MTPMTPMTPTPPPAASGTIEFPNDLEILVTRRFDAPVGLVFNVFTKAEHVRHHFAPYDETMTVCSIDSRVGGEYHLVFVTKDGYECSFRGTIRELEPPTHLVQTWHFDGWPDADALETMDLEPDGDGTKMTYRLTFTDQTGRARMDKYDGVLSSFDNVATYLERAQEPAGA